jgi:methionyl-tRNA synthetase
MANFFIATAIDYTNSAPHVGHAYEKLLADVMARYHRLRGDAVFFLTGVDQHGQKVQLSAAKEKVDPPEFVGRITSQFLDLWATLEISYDGWAATTEPRHIECVQRILRRLYEGGQIYKAKQGGYYSVRQEQFITDKERAPDGQFGIEWGEVEYREEENYYFRLAEHRSWLLELLDSNPNLVFPDFRRSELRNALEKLSGDLCVSRPKSRLAWGIELPFDREYVTYVWFDALTNYISFAPGGYDPRPGGDLREFGQWWPADIVIGKDILVPAHGIYWMIMLHALGFRDEQMPRLIVHGWWNIAGAKMSKSLGNAVDPKVLASRYGVEALRYYLTAELATGRDADFSEERLVARYNGDLANSLGNLLNRTLNMIHRYRNGTIRKPDSHSPLAERAAETTRRYTQSLDRFEVQAGMQAVLDLATICNTYIDMTAPWKLAKDESRADALDSVLYALAESLRIISILISPVLPKAAGEMLYQLNWKGELRREAIEWGGLPDGHKIGKADPVFPRLEQ